MKTIIHDLGKSYDIMFRNKYDNVIQANGNYAYCKGCFNCWSKYPAQCFIKDPLQMASHIVGRSDTLVIVTENCYGSYSPSVKRVLDRGLGLTTPLSTYRAGQMHHRLRYGPKTKLIVYVYGDMTEKEQETFEYMAKKNSINYGFQEYEFYYLASKSDIGAISV